MQKEQAYTKYIDKADALISMSFMVPKTIKEANTTTDERTGYNPSDKFFPDMKHINHEKKEKTFQRRIES